MNVKSKLEWFNTVAVDSAIEAREADIDELKKQWECICKKTRKDAIKFEQEHYKEECLKFGQIKNKEVAETVSEEKRKLLSLRGSFIQKTFDRVISKTKEFTETAEYKNYLLSEIETAKENVEKNFSVEEMIIYLRKKDISFKSEIHGTIMESEKDFIGGFKMLVNGNILIDNTFDTRINDLIENYEIFI